MDSRSRVHDSLTTHDVQNQQCEKYGKQDKKHTRFLGLEHDDRQKTIKYPADDPSPNHPSYNRFAFTVRKPDQQANRKEGRGKNGARIYYESCHSDQTPCPKPQPPLVSGRHWIIKFQVVVPHGVVWIPDFDFGPTVATTFSVIIILAAATLANSHNLLLRLHIPGTRGI